MPNDDHPLKRLPAGAVQHVTAGPYSPVLEVNADAPGRALRAGRRRSRRQRRRHDHGGAGGGDARELPAAARERRLRLSPTSSRSTSTSPTSPNGRASTPSTRRAMPPPLPVRTAVQAVLLAAFASRSRCGPSNPGTPSCARRRRRHPIQVQRISSSPDRSSMRIAREMVHRGLLFFAKGKRASSESCGLRCNQSIPAWPADRKRACCVGSPALTPLARSMC